MTEENLAALAESGKSHLEKKAPTHMQEVNEVLKSCSFGFFHVRLLISSFFGTIAGSIVSNTPPYILPSAECDLNMNLVQKGILNSAHFIGMVVSSIPAGFLTDTFGRKKFLVIGNGGMFLFTIFSGLSQTFEMMIIGKFFEGILAALAYSSTLTFTFEYCHDGIRDRVMLLQSSFQACSLLLVAGYSWAILTQEWRLEFFNGSIVLNTWNFYLLLSSTISLTACSLYVFLPESPKFLVSQHKYEEAKKTLTKVYVQNTWKSADTFPHPNLWKNLIKSSSLTTGEEKRDEGIVTVALKSIKVCKSIFKKPLGPQLALFCSMIFLIMGLYNIIKSWFPQISTIVEHYEIDANQNLCFTLDKYTDDLKTKTLNTTDQGVCIPKKSGDVTFMNTLILGSVCFVPFILSGVLVNKVGKKFLLLLAGCVSIGCTLGLRWAHSKAEVVALFSTDMAVSQTMLGLLQTITIEVFPTATRTLAISLLMMFGRIGSLVGNVVFPILLELGCVVPFFTLAGLMLWVTVTAIMLPNKKN